MHHFLYQPHDRKVAIPTAPRARFQSFGEQQEETIQRGTRNDTKQTCILAIALETMLV